MSRNIPPVGRYLINFWKEGRCIASYKTSAPTKLLAWLNAVHEDPRILLHKLDADKLTISRLRRPHP